MRSNAKADNVMMDRGKKPTGPLHDAFSAKVLCLMLVVVMLLSWNAEAVSEEHDARSAPPERILVLHSYDQGLSWTHSQHEGIIGVFKDAGERYSLYVENMDWRNYADEENLKQLRERFSYKYSDKKIDLIITTDGAALEFALASRKEMFSDAPVIFSGITDKEVKRLTDGHDRVTGVIEEIDPAGTVRAAYRINPGIRRIYIVYDNSESGILVGEITTETVRELVPDADIVALNSIYPEMVYDIISKAGQDSVVISTAFMGGMDGTIEGYDYFCSELSRISSIPIYHLYDVGLGNGAIGGSVAVGRLLGEEAAKAALKVLNGEDISNIPFIRQKTTQYVFDYNLLDRFGVDISLLPKESVIINRPYSFLEENLSIVLTVVIIIVMLLMFITILLFYLKRLQMMKNELAMNNSKLTGLYEDLSAASRKLKKQYDELAAVQSDLNSSEYKLGLLFEKMMNGFFIFEPVYNSMNRLVDLRFLNVNPGFFQNMGIPEAEITGMTWLEFFGSPNAYLAHFQNLIDTGRSERFEVHDARTGSYHLVEPFLITENQVGVMFENITDYKKALKEVRKLNADLEKRVADRTAKLQEAVKDLEAFAYTVSHDMKSPLRAVDGYASILMEDFAHKLDSDAVQMLNNISRISRESIEMINKILQYSRTSTAVMNIEPLDMESLVKEVFDELMPAYPNRDIDLVIESGLPGVNGDRILLKQMLQNLLSNSMKFTVARDRAVITVGCTITHDFYIFYIKDNGAGFDMKYSDKLFGLFQRLHSADEFEGSGIGLITVKKIIEKHEGKVWIEGKVDEGATVFFTLPVKP
jgi:signal transduction histidine kinase